MKVIYLMFIDILIYFLLFCQSLSWTSFTFDTAGNHEMHLLICIKTKELKAVGTTNQNVTRQEVNSVEFKSSQGSLEITKTFAWKNSLGIEKRSNITI